ncbi:MAG: insulinase family protein, partial [Bacteroidetes bacterium]
MQNIDRTIAPEIKDIENVNIRQPQRSKLSNGVPVFSFDVSEQDFVKIELSFDAGSSYSEKALVASVTNKLLTEGTKKHTSSEIANIIDSFGGFFETSISKDSASVILYTLNKYMNKTLPILAEIVKEPIFKKEELDLFLAQKRNEHLVNQERVAYIARSSFAAMLFGENHPYGRILKMEDFDRIDRQDIIDFHQNYYLNGRLQIFTAGKMASNTLSLLDTYFGDMEFCDKVDTQITVPFKPSIQKFHQIEKDEAVQNAIRIGKPIINQQHPDFHSLRILNTIFGGYFGSRLMTNIREDKGYTYGIGSGIMSMRDAAFFFISSEVKADVTNLAIDEILKEINLLQTQLVGTDELNLVKNYLQGEFQRSFDGPFALLSRFKEIHNSG